MESRNYNYEAHYRRVRPCRVVLAEVEDYQDTTESGAYLGMEPRIRNHDFARFLGEMKGRYGLTETTITVQLRR